MNFVEFVTITRPILGGKGGVHIYVRTLFDAILTENGKKYLMVTVKKVTKLMLVVKQALGIYLRQWFNT